MSVVYIKSAREYEKYKKNGLVIVDFNTEWCKPCKAYKPTFEENAAKNSGIKFLSVDAEKIEHEDCKDVRSVPTFKIFLNGELKRSFSGIDDERLEKYIVRYSIQIYEDDKLIRKFTPELQQKVKNYLDGLGIRINVNGERCRKFNNEKIEKVLDYLHMFSFDEKIEEKIDEKMEEKIE